MIRKFNPHTDNSITGKQARDFDKWAIESAGIAGVVLMENAGRSCAELTADTLKQTNGSRVCILCGTGNNGGDGFVIARHLHNHQIPVKIIICGDSAKIRGDAKANYDLAKFLELDIVEFKQIGPEMLGQAEIELKDCDLLVDAIFGTGLSGQIKDKYLGLIEKINSLKKPIIAVDIPSGLDCDTGEPLPIAVRARKTVTFIACKKGFITPVGSEYAGEVYVASIGIEK